ncbi:MAG: sodium:solute symporter, partial [Candidatus Omnitrophica bacterium]|nr:sodium:solute symporter [Candidatus Omnitrophota bacterium]
MNLSWVDAGIVVVYLVAVLLVGVYMERRAGKDIQSYFLGGGTLPWWMLGMSGSSTYFDITGTMWMVSVFYVLGIRGMWEQWFWAFPFAGFAMAYKGKWAYRSGVLTGMEWLVFRYGTGRQGQSARLTMVLINLLIMVFMLGYAGIGVGIFLEEFLPFGRNTMVVGLFAITGLYVLLGGFFSVVWSDFFQTILLSVAAVYISVTAFLQIDPATFRT